MTKQEKIREAYGEHFEAVKDYVDENGWCDLSIMPLKWKISEINDIDIEDFTWFRPKSLAGIEDNNGWIKIESEDDLPISTIMYHVVLNGKKSKALYAGKNRWFVNGNDFPKTTEIHGITHYQPIIETKPPIY
jgi:hypothetical protein